jgi:hypothetical protein
MTDPEDQLYKAVPFASLPGWEADDQLEAFGAFCASVPGGTTSSTGAKLRFTPALAKIGRAHV